MKLGVSKALLLGLPDVASADPNGALWHTDSNDVPSVSLSDIARAIGSNWKPDAAYGRACAFYSTYVNAYPQFSRYTARQFFAHLKGPFQPVELADPPVYDELPDNFCAECRNGVNTYTDGSLVNPTLAPFTIGGGAILYSDRDFVRYPLTHNEICYSFQKNHTAG